MSQSQTTKQCVRLVGVTVIATAFLVAVLLTLQTRSPSQAASSGAIANRASISDDVLPASGARGKVLNTNMSRCSSTWVIETVDSTGDVGKSTSLALAPTYPYIPHISYHDVTSDNLKYAWLSGATWFSQTVDSGGDTTSLALVPTPPHTPCISYCETSSPNFWDWLLNYTCRNGATWITTTLSSGMRAGLGGLSLALEPTYPFTPHMSYYNPWGTIATLHHSYLSGTIWMSGTWVHEQVEPSGSHAGTWSSLALDSNNSPRISYYIDSTDGNDDLKYAWKNGATWLSDTVDTGGDVGWYTSLALDSSGNPHISYLDETNDVLKYAWLSGTTWLSETVDSVGKSVWYGWGTSLALDRVNVPYISYYNAINRDLKIAWLDDTVWITETVDSEGDVGPFSSLALDQLGCPHISYYDATNGDLKYAYMPPLFNYLPIILKNY